MGGDGADKKRAKPEREETAEAKKLEKKAEKKAKRKQEESQEETSEEVRRSWLTGRARAGRRDERGDRLLRKR